jgi:hypothetical protein
MTADIPRLLGAMDRNPLRPTYGCLDREYWHYRTASFPSQMYQEGVLPLALAYAHPWPGNRWHQETRVRELAIAGIRFAAQSSHADGSCDDYYPFERALGAAVFSLCAAARACQILGLDDVKLAGWLGRRADWVARNDESGRLANHHAAAAWGLLLVAEITGQSCYRKAAEARIDRVLDWQDEEGWFEEYGGADPGYQTVTIDYLAKYRRGAGDGQIAGRLDGPLRRATAFAGLFLHPDHSYAGEYGSRGTYHFYPHGMELLAAQDADAAELADGFLRSVARGTRAHFSDDRLFIHQLGNRIEAYLDWSSHRPPARPGPKTKTVRYLPHAGILVRRTDSSQTVISAARGGIFKHFGPSQEPQTDAGLIVQTADRRVAASQWHDRNRRIEFSGWDGREENGPSAGSFSVDGPLCWTRFEVATPLKLCLLQTGMWLAGRWCRTLVRRLLQRRLITGRRECPIRLTRRFEFAGDLSSACGDRLRVSDTIELTDSKLAVRRMAFGTDHQTAYVAASGVYQEAVLGPWTDLSDRVDELNERRRIVVVREI